MALSLAPALDRYLMKVKEKDSPNLPPELMWLRRKNEQLESNLAELTAVVQSLRSSERQYKYMIHHMGEGIGIADLDERFIFCNASAERLFGARPGKLTGRNLREFTSPAHFEEIRNETNLRRQGVRSAYETEIRAEDGVRRILSIIALPWFDPDGAVCGTFATFRNATAQRLAEEVLQLERDKAQSYLDIAGVMLVAIDAERKVTMINRRGCDILGYDERYVLGKDWFECFIPERLRTRAAHVFDRLIGGEIDLVEYFENPVLNARGEERLMAWHNTMITDHSGLPAGTLSSGEDITDRKLTEQNLLRLERMRAMAQMTSAISHNLNNILAGVIAHCQFLQKASHDAGVLKEASAIMDSAHRAENLVRRLEWAVFGRHEEIEPVSLNAHVLAAVEEIRSYCDNGLNDGDRPVEILTTLDEVGEIRATAPGMNDVLVNVLLNAVDAMPNGGTVRVSTRPTGDAVQLTVRDNGRGMDEETRRRVFEPFFTTKGTVGTGLGLSTAHGAVTRWGGTIDVKSRPGVGTSVTILFERWEGRCVRPDRFNEDGT